MNMIRLPPHPHQGPQIHDFGKHYGGPKSPTRGSGLLAMSHQQQHQQQQPLRHFPQQYAYPLQASDAYPNGGRSVTDSRLSAVQSENLLRRKTPNGILHGAYDGTTVEQSHATKHILLPASTQNSTYAPDMNNQQDIILRSPKQQRISQLNAEGKHNGPAYQQHMSQLDSVLNQLPAQTPPIQFTMGYNQFPSLIPPPLQNPLVPTISNDNGLYGPYFANGAFAPYRPAAMRDPRFPYTHAGSFNLLPSGIQGLSDWQLLNGNIGNVSDRLNPVQQNAFPSIASGPPPQNLRRSSGARPMPFANGYAQNPFSPAPGHSQPGPTHLQSPPGFDLAGPPRGLQSSTPSSSQTPTSLSHPTPSPLTEFGSSSDNGQLRERVFTWAHAIYVDLLKYLHQTRKIQSHGRQSHGHQQFPRPNFYPKPPRQPGSDFTSPSSIQNRTDSASHSTSPRLKSHNQSRHLNDQSNGSFSRHRHSAHGRSSSLWSPNSNQVQDDQRRLSWQLSSKQQQSQAVVPYHAAGPPQDKYRTLRRTAGATISPMYAGSPLGLTSMPPMTPITQASNALDSLSTLCQESGWTWVEGMLLGGSLAYGLSDYGKALTWYSKILEIDKK